jgi:YbbR domain-containing protein
MVTDARRASSPWVRAFTDNLGLKVTALGLSILLFYLVHSDVDAQRAIYVDVVALLPPPGSGKTLISELPAQVKVTLRGSRSKLSSLSRDELGPIQLDLREAADGPYYLDASLVDAGSNVQVVEILPSSVQLSWAVESEKRVPIEVALDGKPGKGLELAGAPQVEPGFVTLRGPEGMLSGIKSVSTETLSLARFELGAYKRRVPLEPPPEHVVYVESNTAAEVTFSISPAVAERTFRRLEVAAVGEGRSELRPDRVSVTLRGPHELLEELEPEALVPYVELDPAHVTGTRSYDVRLRGVPDGIAAPAILPPSVLVRPKGKP